MYTIPLFSSHRFFSGTVFSSNFLSTPYQWRDIVCFSLAEIIIVVWAVKADDFFFFPSQANLVYYTNEPSIVFTSCNGRIFFSAPSPQINAYMVLYYFSLTIAAPLILMLYKTPSSTIRQRKHFFFFLFYCSLFFLKIKHSPSCEQKRLFFIWTNSKNVEKKYITNFFK